MKSQFLFQPNKLLKSIYPKAIWNFGRDEEIIYLTFEDGPIEELTPWVLNELEKFEAKATFFCVGSNIIKNKEIFEQIKLKGHQVANHTMFHSKGFKLQTQDYTKDVEDCKNLIGNKLFRPPYGRMKRKQYKSLVDLGYRIIMWDVISYDYEKISQEKVLENVIQNTKAGSIVLFHDSLKAEENLRYVLPKFLEHFTQLGFKFEAIKE